MSTSDRVDTEEAQTAAVTPSSSASSASASKDRDGVAVGRLLRGFTDIFSKEKSRTQDPPRDSSPAHRGTAESSAVPSPSASGGGPDKAQAQIIAAIASGKKEKEKEAAAAAAARSPHDAPRPIRNKFLDIFKSDAVKRHDRDREAAAAQRLEEEAARTKAAAAAAAEPIKLELRSAETEAGLPPIVGSVIHADGFVLRSTGASAPLPLGAGSRGVCRWFRASEDGFDQIVESIAPLYTPTVDDVGCRVCCQWVMEATSGDDVTATDNADVDLAASMPVAQQSSFAEVGPILMDAALEQASLALFKGGKAVFHCQEQDSEERVTITVKKTMIRVLASEGGEVKCTFMLMRSGASGAATSPVKFALDSIDPMRFAIEDVNAHKVFRGTIIAEGDESQLARARRERDVMACLVRRIIKTGSAAIVTPKTITATTSTPTDTQTAAVATVASPASSLPKAVPSTDLISVDIILSSTSQEDIVSVIIEPVTHSNGTSTSPPVSLVESDSASPVSASGAVETTAVVEPTPARARPTSHLTLHPHIAASTSSSSSPLPSLSQSSSPSVSSSSSSPQVHSLTQRISELTAEKTLFRENMGHMLREQQRAAAAAQATIDQLQAAAATHATETVALTRELDQRGEDVDALRLAIQNLSEQMSNLANTEIRLSNEARALKNEREAMREEARKQHEAHAAQIAEMQAAATQADAKTRALQEQLATATSDLAASTSEVHRLTPAADRCARLLETEANLRHDIGLYKADIARLQVVQTKLETVEMENHRLRKEKERRRHAVDADETGGERACGKHQTLDVPTEGTPAGITRSLAHSLSVLGDDTATELSLVIVSVKLLSDVDVPFSGANGVLTSSGDTAATATAVADATDSLAKQCSLLQARFAELMTAHTASMADLARAEEQLSTLRAESATTADVLTTLQASHAELTQSHGDLVASRNYYKRKCESLSASVDKMLKESSRQVSPAHTPTSASSAGAVVARRAGGLTSSASSSHLVDRERTDRDRHASEVKRLHATIHALRGEHSEFDQTIAAYKKTLESTLQLLKHEREANLLLSKGAGSGASSGGLFSRGSKRAQLLHQFESVRDLANSLSEIIADKDLTLAHLRKTNGILSARVAELEKRFEAELEADDDATPSSRRRTRHIDLDDQSEHASTYTSAASSLQASRRNSQVPTPTAHSTATTTPDTDGGGDETEPAGADREHSAEPSAFSFIQ